MFFRLFLELLLKLLEPLFLRAFGIALHFQFAIHFLKHTLSASTILRAFRRLFSDLLHLLLKLVAHVLSLLLKLRGCASRSFAFSSEFRLEPLARFLRNSLFLLSRSTRRAHLSLRRLTCGRLLITFRLHILELLSTSIRLLIFRVQLVLKSLCLRAMQTLKVLDAIFQFLNPFRGIRVSSHRAFVQVARGVDANAVLREAPKAPRVHSRLHNADDEATKISHRIQRFGTGRAKCAHEVVRTSAPHRVASTRERGDSPSVRVWYFLQLRGAVCGEHENFPVVCTRPHLII